MLNIYTAQQSRVIVVNTEMLLILKNLGTFSRISQNTNYVQAKIYDVDKHEQITLTFWRYGNRDRSTYASQFEIEWKINNKVVKVDEVVQALGTPKANFILWNTDIFSNKRITLGELKNGIINNRDKSG